MSLSNDIDDDFFLVTPPTNCQSIMSLIGLTTKAKAKDVVKLLDQLAGSKPTHEELPDVFMLLGRIQQKFSKDKTVTTKVDALFKTFSPLVEEEEAFYLQGQQALYLQGQIEAANIANQSLADEIEVAQTTNTDLTQAIENKKTQLLPGVQAELLAQKTQLLAEIAEKTALLDKSLQALSSKAEEDTQRYDEQRAAHIATQKQQILERVLLHISTPMTPMSVYGRAKDSAPFLAGRPVPIEFSEEVIRFYNAYMGAETATLSIPTKFIRQLYEIAEFTQTPELKESLDYALKMFVVTKETASAILDLLPLGDVKSRYDAMIQNTSANKGQ